MLFRLRKYSNRAAHVVRQLITVTFECDILGVVADVSYVYELHSETHTVDTHDQYAALAQLPLINMFGKQR